MERGDPGDDEREGLLAESHGPTTQPPPERARERPEVAAEAVELLCLGVPVSCTSLCRILVFATDAAFVGRLGTTQMAAAALAQVCQSMSNVMIYGTAVALNTLCAQAIGSGNARLVGSWLQLSLVVLAGQSLLVIWAFSHTETVLRMVMADVCFPDAAANDACAEELVQRAGPEAIAPGCICRLAGVWSLGCAWYVPVLALFLALRHYLQALGIVTPTSVVAALTVPLNACSTDLLLRMYMRVCVLMMNAYTLARTGAAERVLQLSDGVWRRRCGRLGV